MRIPVFLSLILLSAPGWAETGTHAPRLDDFAQAMRLHTEDRRAVYRLVLPEAVYRSVAHASLADVRVFNADGASVPTVIRPAQVRSDQNALRVALPIFPLEQVASTENGAFKVQIQQDGSLISVTGNAPESTAIGAWVLDLSKLERGLQRLEVAFTSAPNAIQKVQLARSDNLHDWTPVRAASLVDMAFSGQQLRQNEIALTDGQVGTYLKLQLSAPEAEFRIQGVTAVLQRSRVLDDRRTLSVPARPAATGARLDFDLGGPFRVTRVRLIPADLNTLFSVGLYSRPTAQASWHPHGQGAFYRLGIDDTVLEDQGVGTTLTAHRYWQARFPDDATLPVRAPTLEVEWQADQLYFLAQGEGPWQLAFGNREVAPKRLNDSALAAQLNQPSLASLLGEARLQDPTTLRGAAALEGEQTLPWLRWGLWAVLIAGAAMAGIMGWRLSRQMMRR